MISLVGLSHKTAPIHIREQLAVAKESARELLTRLVDGPAQEALVLSTCNRVEVLAAAPRGDDDGARRVTHHVTQVLEGAAPGVHGHLYTHDGTGAVRHLFRVAASLDSLVLGEPQILGQLKGAFEEARKARTLGPALHRVVPRAIRAAKRVRTETSIGSGLVSVPSVAMDLATQIFGSLRRRTVVLLGSGEMAETLAKLLAGAGARVLVVGRNEARVGELAGLLGGEGQPMAQLEASLTEADVVVTSTSAPSYLITRELMGRVARRRGCGSLFFIDLAVPRDVDPRVDEIDGVFSYNVDDLSQVVAQSLSTRQQEAARAEHIILQEAEGFARWVDESRVTPLVVALRERFHDVLQSEMERSLRGRLKHLPGPDREALSKMLDAVEKKLLHAPTTHLREAAAGRDLEGLPVETLAGALGTMFDLDTTGRPAPAPAPAARTPSDEPDDPAPRVADDEGGRALL